MSEVLQFDPQDDGEPPSPNFLNYDITAERRPWAVDREDHDDVFNYMDLALSFVDRQKPEDIAADTAAINLVNIRRAELERIAIERAASPTIQRRLGFGKRIMAHLRVFGDKLTRPSFRSTIEQESIKPKES